MPETYRPTDPEDAEIWDDLELAPPSPVPSGFAGRVVAHCREQSVIDPVLSPWVRLAAAAALLLGIGIGVGVPRAANSPAEPPIRQAAEETWSYGVPSLAEVYWSSERIDDPPGEDLP